MVRPSGLHEYDATPVFESVRRIGSPPFMLSTQIWPFLVDVSGATKASRSLEGDHWGEPTPSRSYVRGRLEPSATSIRSSSRRALSSFQSGRDTMTAISRPSGLIAGLLTCARRRRSASRNVVCGPAVSAAVVSVPWAEAGRAAARAAAARTIADDILILI